MPESVKRPGWLSLILRMEDAVEIRMPDGTKGLIRLEKSNHSRARIAFKFPKECGITREGAIKRD